MGEPRPKLRKVRKGEKGTEWWWIKTRIGTRIEAKIETEIGTKIKAKIETRIKTEIGTKMGTRIETKTKRGWDTSDRGEQMKLVDTDKGIEIDSDFPCSSAGDMRILEDGSYEIGFQPEELPQWFQDVLDELFDGKGVPKEYMAHVRVTNTGPETRQARLRFLLSGKGSSYMYPPWWVRRETGWEWIPLEDTSH